MAKYEFIKIEDKPTMTSEYIGEIETSTTHTKNHEFNLSVEGKQKLLDIIMKYGLTRNDFSDEDKKNHPYFYKILCNNKRYGNDLVYYYYSKELEPYDLPDDKEQYKNGILLYGVSDIMSVHRAYRLTEKPDKDSDEKGFVRETLDSFKNFFLEKRKGHDFKKDLEDILNAEDNAKEYETVSRSKYYHKTLKRPVIGRIKINAKSPRMDFILNKTNLTSEAKEKFMKYEDLIDFVDNVDIKQFDKNELKEFFKAVDAIDNEYMLHYDLMDKVEELKENLGL